MKVFKFMIDIYNDDFGTFRNVYHSLGGIYIQIGNMPFNLRKQLKNHFIVGFIPFGAILMMWCVLYFKSSISWKKASPWTWIMKRSGLSLQLGWWQPTCPKETIFAMLRNKAPFMDVEIVLFQKIDWPIIPLIGYVAHIFTMSLMNISFNCRR